MAPPTKNQHGIIREYHVEIHTESSQLNVTVETYTTENQFIIVENLTPNTSYTCAVAAYTIRMGPYSELISFSLHSETYTCINQALTADLECE